MSNNRDTATLRVYAALQEYERALDIAATRGAQLAAEMPQARLDANFAAEVGQGAFQHVIHSLGDIASARGRVVEGHRELAAVRTQFRLPVLGAGDKTPMPSGNLKEDRRDTRAA